MTFLSFDFVCCVIVIVGFILILFFIRYPRCYLLSIFFQLNELTAAMEQDKVTQKATAAKAKELEAKVRDIKGHRERYVVPMWVLAASM